MANAAAWNNLGAANEDEDGQKGAEEEEDGGDPMWNTFQSRDDIEREKVSSSLMSLAEHGFAPLRFCITGAFMIS